MRWGGGVGGKTQLKPSYRILLDYVMVPDDCLYCALNKIWQRLKILTFSAKCWASTALFLYGIWHMKGGSYGLSVRWRRKANGLMRNKMPDLCMGLSYFIPSARIVRNPQRYSSHQPLWTESTRPTAGYLHRPWWNSWGPGASRHSGVSWLNSGLKRWPHWRKISWPTANAWWVHMEVFFYIWK